MSDEDERIDRIAQKIQDKDKISYAAARAIAIKQFSELIAAKQATLEVTQPIVTSHVPGKK